MTFTSTGGPPWPVWIALAGVVGVGLSVLSGLFCALAWVLGRRAPRSRIAATAALFVVSAAAVGLIVVLTPVLFSADTVR